MKKVIIAVFLLSLFSGFTASVQAASVSDQTDLFIEDLVIGDYSMALHFTAGNQGGEAGYSNFRSEAEIGKVLKNSYTLMQGTNVLYSFTQEWNDTNSQSAEYRYTDSRSEIINIQFSNLIENLVTNGESYQVKVCLDATNKLDESDEANNCATAMVLYAPYPDGDADGDGMSNAEEGYLNLDPYNSDTDGDGLSDPTELALTLTDPHEYDTFPGDEYDNDYDYDTDGDGLSNGYEVNDFAPGSTAGNVVIGTPGNFVGEGGNPLNFDTDEDGLGDFFEYTYTSYGEDYCPLDISFPDGDHDGILDGAEDCDDDGLDNLSEYELGTSPILEDTDGDTYSDALEVEQGTDPLDASSMPSEVPSADEDGDEDGDGLTNGEEAYYGTDPFDADSDNDYYTDYEELNANRATDPLVATSTPANQYDTDGDRIIDLFDQDDDGDGLRDRYEIYLGLSPRSSDTDGDGVMDGQDLAPLDSSQS